MPATFNRSSHDVGYVTTELLWHVRNCYLIESLEIKLQRKDSPWFQLWAYKLLVKYVSAYSQGGYITI